MNKVAQAVKLAQQLSALTPAQRVIYQNRRGLNKVANWIVKHPDMAKNLRKNVMAKVAAANEPKFTLGQALQVIAQVADQMYKSAQAKVASEQAEVDRFVNIIKRASEKLNASKKA